MQHPCQFVSLLLALWLGYTTHVDMHACVCAHFVLLFKSTFIVLVQESTLEGEEKNVPTLPRVLQERGGWMASCLEDT